MSARTSGVERPSAGGDDVVHRRALLLGERGGDTRVAGGALQVRQPVRADRVPAALARLPARPAPAPPRSAGPPSGAARQRRRRRARGCAWVLLPTPCRQPGTAEANTPGARGRPEGQRWAPDRAAPVPPSGPVAGSSRRQSGAAVARSRGSWSWWSWWSSWSWSWLSASWSSWSWAASVAAAGDDPGVGRRVVVVARARLGPASRPARAWSWWSCVRRWSSSGTTAAPADRQRRRARGRDRRLDAGQRRVGGGSASRVPSRIPAPTASATTTAPVPISIRPRFPRDRGRQPGHRSGGSGGRGHRADGRGRAPVRRRSRWHGRRRRRRRRRCTRCGRAR